MSCCTRTSSRKNVKRFRGGLVFKAHRLLYHSTQGLRVIKKKTRTSRRVYPHLFQQGAFPLLCVTKTTARLDHTSTRVVIFVSFVVILVTRVLTFVTCVVIFVVADWDVWCSGSEIRSSSLVKYVCSNFRDPCSFFFSYVVMFGVTDRVCTCSGSG